MDSSLRMGKNVLHENTHQGVTSTQEYFNKVNKTTCVDTSQLLSPSTHVTAQRVHAKRVMVAEMKGMLGIDSMNFNSPKPI